MFFGGVGDQRKRMNVKQGGEKKIRFTRVLGL